MFISFQTVSRVRQFFHRNSLLLISCITLLVLGSFYNYAVNLVHDNREAREIEVARVAEFQRVQLEEIEKIAKSIEQSNILALQRLRGIEETAVSVEEALKVRDAEHDAMMKRFHDIERRLLESRHINGVPEEG